VYFHLNEIVVVYHFLFLLENGNLNKENKNLESQNHGTREIGYSSVDVIFPCNFFVELIMSRL